MPSILEGDQDGRGLRIAVVVSRFNQPIPGRLLEGALEALRERGVDERAIDVAWVPGAFEIPRVAARFARGREHDAVICLGAVIRGETGHFDLIAAEAARGIADAGREGRVPVIFGVLTTENGKQALERSGGRVNRGADAALAAIEMVRLEAKLER
ncbi:MAG: 6,7-dimethyl-8-ribityllumazine synthase [Planctomycetota bacterium]